jgi:hypothetical protein
MTYNDEEILRVLENIEILLERLTTEHIKHFKEWREKNAV